MTYSILAEAREEFKDTFIYYEEKQPGLGSEFSDEFYTALNRILSSPEAWTEIRPGIRRCLTQRFPYSLLYHFNEEEQKIIVVAVMNTYQKPGYWESRKF